VFPTLLAIVGLALVLPIHRRLEPVVGNPVASTLGALTLLAGLGGTIGAIVFLLHMERETLADAFGTLEPSLRTLISDGRDIGLPLPSVEGVASSDMVRNALETLGFGVGRVTSSILVAFFLVLIALVEHDAWRVRVTRLLGDRGPQVVRDALDEIRVYYRTRTIACVVSGVASGLWLAVLDVPSPALWGLLIGVFNYIPTLGSFIGATPPILLALSAQGSTTALAVAVGLFVQEQLIGNLLDPFLQRERVALAPSALLIAVLLASTVLGPSGAFLAGPLVVLSATAFSLSEATRPLVALLQRVETDAQDDAAAETG
jgi:predicted PurR-regulated permease PerM